MTREPDFIGLVEDYLDEHEGVTPLPDATRAAIRARLPSTHQRPAWWPTRRLSPMNTTLKFGLTGAVVAVVALLGLTYIASPNLFLNVGGGDDNPPSAAPATPQPTATPIPQLPEGEIPRTATYRANPFIPVEVLVTVPEGWIGGGDWLLLGPRGVEPPDGMNIRFGSVLNLFADPFARGAGLLDPPVGPSVDDLVEAMTSHADWPTTGSTDVTVDGYAGKVVRLTLPADLDMPTGQFLLFRDEAFGDRWAFEPGQIIDFYIIDVDGERLVLELFSYPDTPAEDIAEREAIVESMQLRP